MGKEVTLSGESLEITLQYRGTCDVGSGEILGLIQMGSPLLLAPLIDIVVPGVGDIKYLEEDFGVGGTWRFPLAGEEQNRPSDGWGSASRVYRNVRVRSIDSVTIRVDQR